MYEVFLRYEIFFIKEYKGSVRREFRTGRFYVYCFSGWVRGLFYSYFFYIYGFLGVYSVKDFGGLGGGGDRKEVRKVFYVFGSKWIGFVCKLDVFFRDIIEIRNIDSRERIY